MKKEKAGEAGKKTAKSSETTFVINAATKNGTPVQIVFGTRRSNGTAHLHSSITENATVISGRLARMENTKATNSNKERAFISSGLEPVKQTKKK